MSISIDSVEKLPLEDKVELLKQILDTERVIITAQYGEEEEVTSDNVYFDISLGAIVIQTDIMTG